MRDACLGFRNASKCRSTTPGTSDTVVGHQYTGSPCQGPPSNNRSVVEQGHRSRVWRRPTTASPTRNATPTVGCRKATYVAPAPASSSTAVRVSRPVTVNSQVRMRIARRGPSASQPVPCSRSGLAPQLSRKFAYREEVTAAQEPYRPDSSEVRICPPRWSGRGRPWSAQLPPKAKIQVVLPRRWSPGHHQITTWPSGPVPVEDRRPRPITRRVAPSRSARTQRRTRESNCRS